MLNAHWMKLCEAVYDQENIFEAYPSHNCLSIKMDLQSVLKCTSDFTFIVVFDPHNNPVRQAMMIVSI